MRRGRPKKGFGKLDKGINEVFWRRQHSLNKEPLDLLLDLGIIDNASHSSAMTLRRLFVLKHGIPSIQSKNFIKIPGRASPKYKDETWKAAQQFVYNEVMDSLVKLGYAKTITDICIYGIMPRFLINKQNPLFAAERQQFKEGIDTLKSILTEYREILNSKALN
ncbi:MAG: hypothetical protein ACK5WS_02845 [Alphaproteobacteria bacterium]|jgi:hypothetical protein|nr:hypothetical protein [Candidatus Jidaibacter sp.]